MSLDPNIIAALGTALVAIAGWAYHKVRGDKQAGIADIARDLVDQALHLGIVTVESNLDELRTKANEYALRGLTRLGVPLNAVTKLLVSGAVEAGIAEALGRAREHDRYVAVALARAQAEIKATLPRDPEAIAKPPTAPTMVDKLLDGVDLEIREPNRDGEYHPAFPR